MVNGESTGLEEWPPHKQGHLKKKKSLPFKEKKKKPSENKGGTKEARRSSVFAERKARRESAFTTSSEKLARAESLMFHKRERDLKQRNCLVRCFDCTNTLVNLSMFWGRQLNLAHAAIGSLHEDPDTPTAIVEIKQNVLRWKKRVEIQISMAFFLNKIIRIFFWILLLSFIPVSLGPAYSSRVATAARVRCCPGP